MQGLAFMMDPNGKEYYYIDAAKRNEMLTSKRSKHTLVDFVIFPRVNSIDTYSEFREVHEAKNLLTGKKMMVPTKMLP